MQSDSGDTTSLWMATADVPTYAQLGEDATADVCVIGAGIAGITTAYLLALEGRHVVVLDDGAVGGGETGWTTAHLSNAWMIATTWWSVCMVRRGQDSRRAARSWRAPRRRL